MTPAESPVSEAMIFICEKCGKKLNSNPDQNPARLLQLSLKDKIKAGGEKEKFRAALTSCMDLCPEKEVAVAIFPARSGQEVQREGSQDATQKSIQDQFFTLHGDIVAAADLILERLRRR